MKASRMQSSVAGARRQDASATDASDEDKLIRRGALHKDILKKGLILTAAPPQRPAHATGAGTIGMRAGWKQKKSRTSGSQEFNREASDRVTKVSLPSPEALDGHSKDL